MGKFSFKSSGKTQVDKNIEETSISAPPIGIKTPLELNDKDGFFRLHYVLSDQLHDNLRNLILTNWGERLGLYNFGANLRPITTEFVSLDDFDTEAIERIRSAVGRWMPYIDLEDFSTKTNRTENQDTGVIEMEIVYNIPSLNVSGRRLKVVLYVI